MKKKSYLFLYLSCICLNIRFVLSNFAVNLSLLNKHVKENRREIQLSMIDVI